MRPLYLLAFRLFAFQLFLFCPCVVCLTCLCLPSVARAHEFPDCDEAKLKKGSLCWAHGDRLSCTQGEIGFFYGDLRSAKMDRRSEDQMLHYLLKKKHQIPSIVGPKKKIYMLDHHHLVWALLKSQHKDLRVLVEVKEDWEDMPEEDFEREMIRNDFVHLRVRGGRILSFSDLPQKPSDLGDNPYRSLASLLRKAKLLTKSFRNHSELRQATILEEYYPFPVTNDNMLEAVRWAQIMNVMKCQIDLMQ